jgi:hypothetical protein
MRASQVALKHLSSVAAVEAGNCIVSDAAAYRHRRSATLAEFLYQRATRQGAHRGAERRQGTRHPKPRKRAPRGPRNAFLQKIVMPSLDWTLYAKSELRETGIAKLSRENRHVSGDHRTCSAPNSQLL